MEIEKARFRMVVIVSDFYDEIAGRLLEGVQTTYTTWGGRLENLDVVRVPGAMEIPFALQISLDKGLYQAAVVLGCVIRGETDHYVYVSGQSIGESVRISLEKRVPLGVGILTVDNKEQAMSRSGGKKGNKGEESCKAAIHLAILQAK